MPYDSFHKSNLTADLLAGSVSTTPRGRALLGIERAYNVIDRRGRERQAKIDAATQGLHVDNVEALKELAFELRRYVDVIERPIKDGIPLTSGEAVELCDVAEKARPLTIDLRHAFGVTGAGPMNRHRDEMRHRKCTTTSTAED